MLIHTAQDIILLETGRSARKLQPPPRVSNTRPEQQHSKVASEQRGNSCSLVTSGLARLADCFDPALRFCERSFDEETKHQRLHINVLDAHRKPDSCIAGYSSPPPRSCMTYPVVDGSIERRTRQTKSGAERRTAPLRRQSPLVRRASPYIRPCALKPCCREPSLP